MSKYLPWTPGGVGWRHLSGVLNAVLVAIVLSYAAGFGSGFLTAKHTYQHPSAHHFAQTYSVANELLPPTGTKALRMLPSAPALPTEVENTLYLPAAGNQYPEGDCAAFASTYYVASALWRALHPGSWIRFSPRFPYDQFSDAHSGGQDLGSDPDDDLAQSSTVGVPTYKQLPFGSAAIRKGLLSYGVDNPIPTWALAYASAHKFTITFTHISDYTQGGGAGLIERMETAIAQGHLLLVASPVPPAFDNASINPYVDFTSQADSRGLHEFTVYGYKLDPSAPGGVWFHYRNSWTKQYGVNGDAWYSGRAAGLFLYDVEYETMSAA